MNIECDLLRSPDVNELKIYSKNFSRWIFNELQYSRDDDDNLCKAYAHTLDTNFIRELFRSILS